MAAAVAVTSVLYATRYEVAYLITHSGGAGAATANLDGSGAATPDLVTDTTVNTPIGDIMRGDVNAGTATYLNQAASRATFGLGTAAAGTVQAKTTIEGRTTGAHWWVDADVVAAPGAPRFTVGAATDGTAILRIKRSHSVGKVQ